jgi:hypothetical protein
MVFSLWASIDAAGLQKQRPFDLIPVSSLNSEKYSGTAWLE